MSRMEVAEGAWVEQQVVFVPPERRGSAGWCGAASEDGLARISPYLLLCTTAATDKFVLRASSSSGNRLISIQSRVGLVQQPAWTRTHHRLPAGTADGWQQQQWGVVSFSAQES
eukprot:GHRQ01021838.1.p1 GENE.GHRQ01021838.1~~GHRQ01021838.1.p1  ORF type:complete len:114 (-),score=28.30 GHRQ01021838.1:725-1066(-)